MFLIYDLEVCYIAVWAFVPFQIYKAMHGEPSCFHRD